MSLYDIKGNSARESFDIEGVFPDSLYDVNGNALHDLVVMSFNIQRWSGINANTDIMNGIFDRYKPNIVGFQEHQPSKSFGGVPILQYLQSRWNFTAECSTQINDYSKIMVSDFEYSDHETVYYESFAESRSYQRFYINFKGKRIAVINTHLDTTANQTKKVLQAKELFDAVAEEEYFIILGDFNTICRSVSDNQYIEIMKQFVDAGYNCANCSEQFGFLDTWTDGTSVNDRWCQTDHIITSSNISIDRVTVDRAKLQANTGLVIDHLPIVAYLSVN